MYVFAMCEASLGFSRAGQFRNGRVSVYDPCRRSLQYQFNYSATGPRRIGPLHVISSDRDRSLLIGTYPVWKRTVLDTDQEAFVRYRIRAVSRDASLHDCCVLGRGSCVAVVGCEFRKISAREQITKATITAENKGSGCLATKCRNLAAIGTHSCDLFHWAPFPATCLSKIAHFH